MSSLTFYGGVGEIDGDNAIIEDAEAVFGRACEQMATKAFVMWGTCLNGACRAVEMRGLV